MKLIKIKLNPQWLSPGPRIPGRRSSCSSHRVAHRLCTRAPEVPATRLAREAGCWLEIQGRPQQTSERVNQTGKQEHHGSAKQRWDLEDLGTLHWGFQMLREGAGSQEVIWSQICAVFQETKLKPTSPSFTVKIIITVSKSGFLFFNSLKLHGRRDWILITYHIFPKDYTVISAQQKSD